MIETLILTYFAINIFIAGYNYAEDEEWETKTKIVFGLFIMMFFGSVFVIFYYLSILFSPIYDWVMNEVGFQYKFYFTKYWENILAEDKNKTAEEKIQEIKKITETSSKQMARHAKKVYNKFKY